MCSAADRVSVTRWVLADLLAQSGVLRLQRCRRVGRHLRPVPPRPARISGTDPVPQGLGVDSQVGGDLPDRPLGPRLVRRDRVRLELRRIVLHDHEMSVLRSSGSSVSCVQDQGSRRFFFCLLPVREVAGVIGLAPLYASTFSMTAVYLGGRLLADVLLLVIPVHRPGSWPSVSEKGSGRCAAEPSFRRWALSRVALLSLMPQACVTEGRPARCEARRVASSWCPPVEPFKGFRTARTVPFVVWGYVWV